MPWNRRSTGFGVVLGHRIIHSLYRLGRKSAVQVPVQRGPDWPREAGKLGNRLDSSRRTEYGAFWAERQG